MITLGLDPHPGTHTVVAMNENGATQGYLAVPNTPEGLAQLHEFAGGNEASQDGHSVPAAVTAQEHPVVPSTPRMERSVWLLSMDKSPSSR